MTHEEEIRHQNVILEDIRHQMKLAFEGHQIFERKIDQKFETLDFKIDKLEQKVDFKIDKLEQKVDREFKGIRYVLNKLLGFMDDHDVRIKALEAR